ncbi:MAG: SUMF1/EgtB/PvdO family nonheme iron enzyme [Treponema sp.]|nr:SUMF1/EgtB/PvdO family nonheme iron enzyme [Treponema sp.]
MKRLIASILLALGAFAMAHATTFPAPSADFVLIQGGSFTMGSPANEDWRTGDETQHLVTVVPFYMAKYEVTQKLWREVTGKNPSNFSGDNLPVESVTWLEAVEFCNALSRRDGRTPAYTVTDGGATVSWNRAANGYRLPTEAEWEYAARAGSTTPFYSRKVPGADDVNFYGHYPYQIEQNYFNDSVLETRPGVYRGTTVAVGSFAPNPNGLYDIYGNVGEWCFDYYGDYKDCLDESGNTKTLITEATVYDSAGLYNPTELSSGTRRVYRGGGWNDFGKNLRSAYRAAAQQNTPLYNVGIRLVVSAGPSKGIVTTREAATASKSTGAKSGKTLIIYYSWSGNTRGVAKEIARQTGFDIIELELVKPYSSNYNTVLNEAQRDQHNQARPALKTKIDAKKWAEYDTIIIGYPNWWASIPMPIATLLESYDFSGKRILPFCSHGGGRFGQSLTAIAKLAPNAMLAEGLSIHYSGGSSLARDVEKWLKKNGMK